MAQRRTLTIPDAPTPARRRVLRAENIELDPPPASGYYIRAERNGKELIGYSVQEIHNGIESEHGYWPGYGPDALTALGQAQDFMATLKRKLR